VGRRRLKLAADTPTSRWRNTLDARLLAVNQLLNAALLELEEVAVVDAGDELARRGLAMLAASATKFSTELRSKLHGMRLPLELGACPHCATERPALPSGHCPRCSRLRGAYRGSEGTSARPAAEHAR